MTMKTDMTTKPAPALPRSVPLVGDQPAMRDWAAALVERACSSGLRPSPAPASSTGLPSLFTSSSQQPT